MLGLLIGIFLILPILKMLMIIVLHECFPDLTHPILQTISVQNDRLVQFSLIDEVGRLSRSLVGGGLRVAVRVYKHRVPGSDP